MNWVARRTKALSDNYAWRMPRKAPGRRELHHRGRRPPARCSRSTGERGAESPHERACSAYDHYVESWSHVGPLLKDYSGAWITCTACGATAETMPALADLSCDENKRVERTGEMRQLTQGGLMSVGPDFSEYDQAMEDPSYRERMERTTPFSAEEEAEMYALLDSLADAEASADDASPE